MEEDCQLEMSVRKVDRPDIHANTETIRSAIIRRFYGIAFEPLKSFPRQYEKNRSNS